MSERKDTAGNGTAQSTTSSTNADIDVEKLAEKVYQLMRAEARLAQARGNKRSAKR